MAHDYYPLSPLYPSLEAEYTESPSPSIWSDPTSSAPLPQSQSLTWQPTAGTYPTSIEPQGPNSNNSGSGQLDYYMCLWSDCAQTFYLESELDYHYQTAHQSFQEPAQPHLRAQPAEAELDPNWYIHTIHQPPQETLQEPLKCDICGQAIGLEKDLRRHYDTVHPSGQPFRCCCGRKTHRRDNHMRHLKKCNRDKNGSSFICNQQHEFSSKKEYLRHLRDNNAGGCKRFRGTPAS
ncbi:zinc-responsiveness transcriptional activator [Fusarium albosuccineum]|uniref:Zinc-responsiveness transcriptional activator n=1 Tax=Fusarium albosuccineum TaxID=1237068 RepID=A0A8H4LBY9_9HYPO|nr:zinc-responsiveness transcriptional activator [Fusarium albosuccineum]